MIPGPRQGGRTGLRIGWHLREPLKEPKLDAVAGAEIFRRIGWHLLTLPLREAPNSLHE